jgi:hypothetical protein
MIKNYVVYRFLLAGLLFIVFLAGCTKTKDFTYKHPQNTSRSLHVVLSLDSGDTFRLTIDDKLVAERKIDLKPKGTTGWDTIVGFFETEYVNLSCIRDYVSIKTTSCDFSIGNGPSIKLNFD